MAVATETTKEPSGGEQFNLLQYLAEVRTELQRAEWPNRQELIRLTQVVLTLIAIVALYCGGLDAILGLLTNKLFAR